MKVVLIGAGLQGKAVLSDLSNCDAVKEIVCVDNNPQTLSEAGKYADHHKTKILQLDITNRDAIISLLKDADVAIDQLPFKFHGYIAEAAIEAGVDLVNSTYGSFLPEGIHEKALAAGVTIMPEAGLDPGIDLVLCGSAVSQLDEVFDLHSYCGGFPEKKALTNPLKYKISWYWEGVLKSYKRPARIMENGTIINIPAEEQHSEKWVRQADFPDLGTLELIPNGDAIFFVEALGLLSTIKNASRCAVRWPGHSKMWDPLVKLGFLDDTPIEGLPFQLTPFEFMAKHLGPKLQYGDDEKDLVIMRNIIRGIKDNKKTTILFDMLDERDLKTGLYAMNRTVGFTSSIVAQMIVRGEIEKKGVLTAIRDIPYDIFLQELGKRGIMVRKVVETEDGAEALEN
jgi:lysine 6-dehydrogenase